MSRDKQIDEMAKILTQYEDCGDCIACKFHDCCSSELDAENLYNKGYRKASDVEDWKEIAEGYQKMFEDSYEKHQSELREIFDKIARMIYKVLNDRHYVMGDMCYEFDELEKKYTEISKEITEGNKDNVD